MSHMSSLLTVLNARDKDTDPAPMESSGRDRYELKNHMGKKKFLLYLGNNLLIHLKKKKEKEKEGHLSGAAG